MPNDPALAPDRGAELLRAQQHVRLWRLSLRVEYASLALIAVLAASIGAAFLAFNFGPDDITGAYGYPLLWVISLLRASSVIIPIPGGGLTVAAGAAMDPLWGIPAPIAVGLMAGSAESLGEFTGYWAGLNGGKLMEGRRLYETVRRWLLRAPFPTVLAMALTPSPVFDVAGIAAGAARIPVRVFYPAVLLGKVTRGIAMGFAGYYGLELLQKLL
jgi:membrane protein YqaA with SNARE-associated domain